MMRGVLILEFIGFSTVIPSIVEFIALVRSRTSFSRLFASSIRLILVFYLIWD